MEFLDGIENVELKPKVIFATAILYMVNADGDLPEEEMNYLYGALKPLGDANHLIELATIYSSRHTIDEFLKFAPKQLDEKQKDILMINIIDAMCVDMDIDKDELSIISKFARAFGMDPNRVNGYISVFKRRYELSVFCD